MLMSTISGPGYSSAPPLYGPPTITKSPLGCVGCGPRGFSGGLGAPSSAAIQELQNSLVAYGNAFGINAEVNPINTSGTLNDETVLGTMYVVWKTADSVPGVRSIKQALNAIPGIGTIINLSIGNVILRAGLWAAVPGGTKAALMEFVGTNATTLSFVVRATTAVKGGLPMPSPGGPNPALVLRPLQLSTRLSPMASGGGGGTVQTFSAKRGKWLIAKPLSGGLGDWLADATHVLAAEADAEIPGTTTVDNETFDKLTGGKPGTSPWYKTTLGKVGIGTGVAGALFAGYWFFVR